MAAFRDRVYMLREEVSGDKAKYFISFTDGQGEYHDLEVSEDLFVEFRQMERKNRNLEQSDERHREYSEIGDEMLNRRARVTPKSVEEIVELRERMETLYREVSALPEKQRRRFVLYYEYGMTYAKIGELEGCTGSSVKCSIDAARQKIIEKLNEGAS
ncbi:MAG: sigma-70 family RNA polymerase sigma factor [Acutalibacter sp.]|nr:sigma-70 family RNA polymerase sigma factor [Acutalibacter sp.]